MYFLALLVFALLLPNTAHGARTLAAADAAEAEIDSAIALARSDAPGDAAAARATLSRHVAAGRGGFDAAVALAAAAGALGLPDEAAGAYARACDIDGGGVALADVAERLLAAGRATEAAAAAAAAAVADPSLLVEALLTRGDALLAAGSPREALGAYETAAAHGGGGGGRATSGIGHAFVALRDPDAAVAHFAAAARAADGAAAAAAAVVAPDGGGRDEAAASAWLNLGSALHDAGRLREAESALEAAAARAPAGREGAAALALGLVRKDAGDMAGAGAAFAAAAAAPGAPPEPAVALVWALLQLGRVDDAAGALRAGMRRHPAHPWWPYIAQVKLLRGGGGGVGEEFGRMLRAARAAGTPDGAAAFAALALKHFVCDRLDGVLNDKARCAGALRAAAAARGAAAFDVHAETYVMPGEAPAFAAAAAVAGTGARWLQKPAWGANGWGVGFLPNASAAAAAAAGSLGEGWIVQRYIEDPLLLEGHKFDLRVFVTVASVHPLRVLVHRHGWANIADTAFGAGGGGHTSHVTNAAFLEGLPAAARACRKWSTARVMRSVAVAAAARGLDGPAAAAGVWGRVKDVVARTVIAGLYDTRGACAGPGGGYGGCNGTGGGCACAHKTFGFDVLIQADSLRVWLIEVNRNPGFDFEGRLFCDEPPMDYDAFAASLATVIAMPAGGAGAAAPPPPRACDVDTSRLPPGAAIDVAREMSHAFASGEVEMVVPLSAPSCAPGVSGPCGAAHDTTDYTHLLPDVDDVEAAHLELVRRCWPPVGVGLAPPAPAFGGGGHRMPLQCAQASE